MESKMASLDRTTDVLTAAIQTKVVVNVYDRVAEKIFKNNDLTLRVFQSDDVTAIPKTLWKKAVNADSWMAVLKGRKMGDDDSESSSSDSESDNEQPRQSEEERKPARRRKQTPGRRPRASSRRRESLSPPRSKSADLRASGRSKSRESVRSEMKPVKRSQSAMMKKFTDVATNAHLMGEDSLVLRPLLDDSRYGKSSGSSKLMVAVLGTHSEQAVLKVVHFYNHIGRRNLDAQSWLHTIGGMLMNTKLSKIPTEKLHDFFACMQFALEFKLESVMKWMSEILKFVSPDKIMQMKRMTSAHTSFPDLVEWLKKM